VDIFIFLSALAFLCDSLSLRRYATRVYGALYVLNKPRKKNETNLVLISIQQQSISSPPGSQPHPAPARSRTARCSF
jgi:hypothetical protein